MTLPIPFIKPLEHVSPVPVCPPVCETSEWHECKQVWPAIKKPNKPFKLKNHLVLFYCNF